MSGSGWLPWQPWAKPLSGVVSNTTLQVWGFESGMEGIVVGRREGKEFPAGRRRNHRGAG